MHRGDALLLFKELCDGRPSNILCTFKSSSSSRFSSLRQQHSFYVVDEKESYLPQEEILLKTYMSDWPKMKQDHFRSAACYWNRTTLRIPLQREQSGSRIILSCRRKRIRPRRPLSPEDRRIRLYGAKEALNDIIYPGSHPACPQHARDLKRVPQIFVRQLFHPFLYILSTAGHLFFFLSITISLNLWV